MKKKFKRFVKQVMILVKTHPLFAIRMLWDIITWILSNF